MKIKEIIADTKFLSPFDISLPLELHTDASRLGGLAYVLLQSKGDKKKAVIHCGSTSLTDTQKNYSTTELELLGIVWGLQKCAFYCKGAPQINVFTDHAALVSLTEKELIKINNSRLVNMLEKIIDFNYKVYHLPGSQNKTADFLSRHTLARKEAPEFPRGKCSVLVRTVRSQSTTWEDASIWRVAAKTAECPEAQQIMEAVKQDKILKELPKEHPARTLSDIWDDAGVEATRRGEVLTFGEKIFIPRN